MSSHNPNCYLPTNPYTKRNNTTTLHNFRKKDTLTPPQGWNIIPTHQKVVRSLATSEELRNENLNNPKKTMTSPLE